MVRILPILNIFSYLCLVVVNFLAIQTPFFGRTPGDVSSLYPNLLTPADFAFKIWMFIYLLLGVFIFYQSKTLFQKKDTSQKEISAIGIYFFISCLFNFGWLIAWQSVNIGFAFLLIFILWLLLIFIYYRLAQLEKARLYYTFPFSIYLAWVCIAALANLNILLIDVDFDFFGLSEEYWTSLLIVIGVFGTLFVLYLNKDIWFTLVLIWAFFGMYIKNKQFSPDDNLVVYTSLTAILILLVVGGWVGIMKWTGKVAD